MYDIHKKYTITANCKECTRLNLRNNRAQFKYIS